MQLEQKNVLLGISGGIAAYKTPDLVRKLKATGANVRVVMTNSATEFVSKLSLQAVSGERIHHEMLDEEAEAGMGHIELARWADVFLIAPATANTIAKLAHGIADDLLTTLALATNAPIFFAPAMNQQMWAAPATAANVDTLVSRGAISLGPAAGEQACGDVGYGRMLEPLEIVEELLNFETTASQGLGIQDSTLLQGKRIMITAGPTREALDPVRYISNHSSGKMGYALASVATQMGASVTLVSGPVTISAPKSCNLISVISAQDMLDAVMKDIESMDIFIGCAAVADFRLSEIPEHKIKKKTDVEDVTLKLVKNPDILKTVAMLYDPPFTLGFAAETQNVEGYAKDKLKSKNLNLIAANDVSSNELGFNSERNALTVISAKKSVKLSPKSKDLLAVELLKILAAEYKEQKEQE